MSAAQNAKFKYPRTFHLPFSEGVQSDDKIVQDLSLLEGMDVVVTEKFDGENTTLYQDGYHARSLDSRHHPSRDYLAQFWGERCYLIEPGMRICGEYLYAQHSLAYQSLESYFLGFSAWQHSGDKNICLDWESTLKVFETLDIAPVRVMYKGTFDMKVLKELAKYMNTDVQEGFVVRPSGSFNYEDFSKLVVKWVRKGHVQTDQHWMQSKIVPNKLA